MTIIIMHSTLHLLLVGIVDLSSAAKADLHCSGKTSAFSLATATSLFSKVKDSMSILYIMGKLAVQDPQDRISRVVVKYIVDVFIMCPLSSSLVIPNFLVFMIRQGLLFAIFLAGIITTFSFLCKSFDLSFHPWQIPPSVYVIMECV